MLCVFQPLLLCWTSRVQLVIAASTRERSCCNLTWLAPVISHGVEVVVLKQCTPQDHDGTTTSADSIDSTGSKLSTIGMRVLVPRYTGTLGRSGCEHVHPYLWYLVHSFHELRPFTAFVPHDESRQLWLRPDALLARLERAVSEQQYSFSSLHAASAVPSALGSWGDLALPCALINNLSKPAGDDTVGSTCAVWTAVLGDAFTVSRAAVHRHPRSTYKDLLRLSSSFAFVEHALVFEPQPRSWLSRPLERVWSLLFGCAEPVAGRCALPSTAAGLRRLRRRCPRSAFTAAGSSGYLVTGEVEPASCRHVHAFAEPPAASANTPPPTPRLLQPSPPLREPLRTSTGNVGNARQPPADYDGAASSNLMPSQSCVATIGRCLQHGAPPPRRCSVECLFAPIPATASYCEVQHCFGPCLEQFVDRGRVAFWSQLMTNGSSFSDQIGKEWTMPDLTRMRTTVAKHGVPLWPPSVLLGVTSDLAVADAANFFYSKGVVVYKRPIQYLHLQMARLASGAKGLNASVVLMIGDKQTGVAGKLPWTYSTVAGPAAGESSQRAPLTPQHLDNNPKGYLPHRIAAYPRGLLNAGTWRALFQRNQTEMCRRQATWHRRSKLLLCSCFHRAPSRKAKLAILEGNGFECGDGQLCGPGFYELMLDYKFVFSPFGNGHNNHRDWEALMAGAVPLLDCDPNLSAMRAGLPVLEICDWGVVTPHFLEAAWRNITAWRRDDVYDLSRLYSPHWIGTILSGTNSDHAGAGSM